MWMEEDAFYPGSYFKETFSVHPEWNVALGVAQVFFFCFFFFWCLSPSGCSHSERTKDSRGSSIPGGSCLPFRKTEVKQNPNPCTPSQVTDREVSSVTVNTRNVRKCKQRPQTMCSSLNTASSDREIQLFIKICGFSSIFMSEPVVSWCWNPHRAALTCSWLWNVSGTRHKSPSFVYPLHNPILPAAMLSYDFVRSWVVAYKVTWLFLSRDLKFLNILVNFKGKTFLMRNSK